jgi:hypothetical protein
MIRIPSEFLEFLRLLNEHRVRYLVVGGYAVAHHGYPRTTADIDIWIGCDQENADRMVSVLAEFGFGVDELDASLFLNKDGLIRMGRAPVRIEILKSIPGVEFNSCYASRETADVDGTAINLIGLANYFDNLKSHSRSTGP